MKFILTKELGRLAKWLRILGFDTEYFREEKISSLIITALRDNRIIITRNRRLSEKQPAKALYIKSEHIREQIEEVLKALNLRPDERAMFSRCTVCNVELRPMEKEKVKVKVPEYVFKTQNEFYTCLNCKRIYWQGTHWGNVKKTLEEIA